MVLGLSKAQHRSIAACLAADTTREPCWCHITHLHAHHMHLSSSATEEAQPYCLQRYAKCPIELQHGGHQEIVLAEQEDKDTQRQILQVGIPLFWRSSRCPVAILNLINLANLGHPLHQRKRASARPRCISLPRRADHPRMHEGTAALPAQAGASNGPGAETRHVRVPAAGG